MIKIRIELLHRYRKVPYPLKKIVKTQELHTVTQGGKEEGSEQQNPEKHKKKAKKYRQIASNSRFLSEERAFQKNLLKKMAKRAQEIRYGEAQKKGGKHLLSPRK